MSTFGLPPYTHGAAKAETYQWPQLHVFQHRESPTYVELRWRGGIATGADLVIGILHVFQFDNIALSIQSNAVEEDSHTVGVNSEWAIKTIRRCVAAKGERAA